MNRLIICNEDILWSKIIFLLFGMLCNWGYYCDMEYYIEIVEFYIILFVNN